MDDQPVLKSGNGRRAERSGARRATARVRPAAVLLAANVVIAVPLLLAVELLARLTTGGVGQLPEQTAGTKALWRYDERLGWSLRPGASANTRLENATRPGPHAAIAHINAAGLRGREVRRDGPGRILVLGDSFAFGVGVDDEQTLAAQLGWLLGPSREVLNGGVSGYSTDQELLWFDRLASLRPEIVVLVVCDNDFGANTEDAAYEVYRKPVFELVDGNLTLRNVPVPTLTPWERAKRGLAARSYAWGWLRTRRSASGETPPLLGWMQVAVPNRTGQEPLRVTTELVAALDGRARAADARLLVMNTARRGEDRLAIGRLLHRLRARGVRCLRIDKAMDAARQARPEGTWDFGSDSHWNVDAHHLAAVLLRAELDAAGWLSSEQRFGRSPAWTSRGRRTTAVQGGYRGVRAPRRRLEPADALPRRATLVLGPNRPALSATSDAPSPSAPGAFGSKWARGRP